MEKAFILNQDILMILGLAGVGSTLGLAFQPLMVVLLLIIFSIYDYIAGYKTKHMIKMAKEMIEQRAILALVIPPNFPGFKTSLEEIRPGGKFLILGGGDIVFPLIFSASLIPAGILNSIIVAFFFFNWFFLQFLYFYKAKSKSPNTGFTSDCLILNNRLFNFKINSIIKERKAKSSLSNVISV